MLFHRSRIIAALSLIVLSATARPGRSIEPEVEALINRIRTVGAEGAGSQDAAAAWKALVARGADALLPTLAALGEAPPRVANWLRTVVDAIVENEKKAARKLPVEQIERFVRRTENPPASRRLAYEILAAEDPQAPNRLLPGMVEDPSVELRRDAIAAALERAAPLVKTKPAEAVATLRRLFDASRDEDQAEQIAKKLRGLRQQVDLADHFGFITRWMVVGPFDSTGGAGYQKPFDPERKVELNATYRGKKDQPIRWASYWTFDPLGSVDLNEALGKHKDAVGYAFAAAESPGEQAVEVRVGCIAAVEVFMNGSRVVSFEEYHHGQRMDQYVGRGALRKGRNEILVKVIQNNQTESWAQEWSFQLRVCDRTGGRVPLKLLTAN